jgi:AraC-like DNA-binding protein
MLLFISVLGILLSVILLYFNARNNKSTLYLGLFFLFLSLYSLYQYILIYSKSVMLVSLLLVNIAVLSSPLYLIGPLLYWYFRSILSDDSRLRRTDFWHVLPAAIFFISAMPHAFTSWPEKMEAARTLIENPDYIQIYKATILNRVFPVFIEFLSRPLLVLGYTLWSAGLFIHYLKLKTGSGVFSKQHFMKSWLWLLLGFLLVLEITQILLIIKGFEMHFSKLYFEINILRTISGSGLIGLLITPLFFPSILYGLPRLPKKLSVAGIAENEETLLPESYTKNQLRLEYSYLDTIGQKVDAYMEESKSYLRPELNLSYVSVQLGVPIHHLGYYFKEVKKRPFHDYRNEWRIKHAKKLIDEGKNNELTLEAIGKLSGFTNRNAFRTAFRKTEGKPPGEYTTSLPELVSSQ